MNCPKCTGVLKSKNYEGIEIDQCDTCHGVWLDKEEIFHVVSVEKEIFSDQLVQATLEKAYAGIPNQEIQTKVKCQKCKIPMSTINYNYSSGIIIDICHKHGIWLDHLELEKIQINREHWKRKIQKDSENLNVILSNVKRKNNSMEYTDGPSDYDFVNILLNFIVNLTDDSEI